MPSAAEWRSLYRLFQREGAKFPNYNMREYVLRRTRDAFANKPGANAGAPEGANEQALWAFAQEELAVVQRQRLVYSLYGRKEKNVMEL